MQPGKVELFRAIYKKLGDTLTCIALRIFFQFSVAIILPAMTIRRFSILLAHLQALLVMRRIPASNAAKCNLFSLPLLKFCNISAKFGQFLTIYD